MLRQFQAWRRREATDGMMLAGMFAGAGHHPFCLSRGYRGNVVGPKLVDAHKDVAAQVGDEALLIAQVASVVVARDRVAGAAFARAQGADLVIMDDRSEEHTSELQSLRHLVCR